MYGRINKIGFFCLDLVVINIHSIYPITVWNATIRLQPIWNQKLVLFLFCIQIQNLNVPNFDILFLIKKVKYKRGKSCIKSKYDKAPDRERERKFYDDWKRFECWILHEPNHSGNESVWRLEANTWWIEKLTCLDLPWMMF